MTDVTGVRHFVTDEAAASGRRFGRYVGVCGRVVLPASLTAPEASACSSCRVWAGRWAGRGA